ncbi:hypothetical protein KFU94_18420 [Chloroflexi bacterium TSY]|nr:hypothetical protein [Chloroflexi bacterium TSY]
MAALKTLRNLDKYEQMLISRFKSHPCFGNLYRFSREEFLTLLLQRRFLSLAFTPVYDMAIDGLTDPQAKQTARHLLREEYPDERGVVLSHREDLVTDLLSLGATRKMLFESHPTDVTLQSIQSTFALFGGYTDDDFYQIRLLTILRFWGEVLVSVEYGMLWDRLEEMGLAPTGGKQSIFYYLHYRHDAKQKSLDDPALVVAIAHADRLAVHLTELLTSPSAIEHCAQVEEEILVVKSQFYDQFINA